MKLLTHNMLMSHVKGVKNGYPLVLLAKQVVVKAVEFNAEFVTRMLTRMDWGVLRATAQSLGYGGDLPESVPEEPEMTEDFMKAVHHVMVEVEIVEGELQCPETGRKFPISEGIPNMLLREDEV